VDPFWVLAAEFWWVAPTAVGAGALGVMGVRRGAAGARGRRLAYDAARADLREAQRLAAERRMAVKVAGAEHARIAAERAASRASAEQVAAARRALRQAEKDAKAASADVRVRKARVKATAADIPSASAPERMPLARLHAAHDAVIARWVDYETDPAKAIAFPSMSDAKDPTTAAFLDASERARDLRREMPERPAPSEFSAYRDAVAQLEHAFDVAERNAQSLARGTGPVTDAAGGGGGWQETAQDVLNRSTEAWGRAADAAASAIAAWNARDRAGRGDRSEPDHRSSQAPGATQPRSEEPPENPDSRRRIWPVPRRDGT
jgi:hypothetical protein